MIQKRKPCAGFSLIECMIVITIGSILASILFPIGQKLVLKAKIFADQQKLRQLAIAYRLTLTETSPLPTDKALLLEALVIHGGATDISLYYSNCSGKKKGEIINSKGKLIENATSDWVFLGGISADTSAGTPVLYSRGLQDDGSWKVKSNSVYGTDGGLIAFLDGHVEYCSHAKEVLVHYNTGKKTGKISEAIPSGATWVPIE